ncbi:hypothetical protein ACLOJK_025382 [Asimina triloba]
MGTSTEKECAAFEEKVRRTVYLDDLSPKVTLSVLKTGLAQFGTVLSAQLIPNYTESMSIPLCALVEMETANQAQSAIEQINAFPFMIAGMPRPVRARAAEVEMFADRPARPSRKIQCRWLDHNDPDFEVAKRLKRMIRRHAAEASMLLKIQLEKEEKLSKKQDEVLKKIYIKYEMLDQLTADKSLKHLADYYESVLYDRS